MALHELATNAAKHGALSTRAGRVSVRWCQPLNGSARDRLVIEWQESGGPSVETPSKSGYGTKVIADLSRYELGATVDLAFASYGVQCRLENSADWINKASRLNSKPNGRYSAQTHRPP